MSPLFHSVNACLSSLHNRISEFENLDRRSRFLILSLIVIAVLGLSYAILRFSGDLEWFEQYGYLGALVASFITSTTIIFPIPGFFVVAAIAASPTTNWALVALAASVGGGLGESTAYIAGYGGAAVIHPKQSKWYDMAKLWMQRHGSATIFVFALTPLPFDVAGISAGALRFPYWKFALATIAGRMPKAFIGCYAAHHLGKELLGDIPWWGWVGTGFGLAIIIGVIVLIWLRRRARNEHAADEP